MYLTTSDQNKCLPNKHLPNSTNPLLNPSEHLLKPNRMLGSNHSFSEILEPSAYEEHLPIPSNPLRIKIEVLTMI